MPRRPRPPAGCPLTEAERAKLIPLPRWADRSPPDQLYKYNERTTERARAAEGTTTAEEGRWRPAAAEAGRQPNWLRLENSAHNFVPLQSKRRNQDL